MAARARAALARRLYHEFATREPLASDCHVAIVGAGPVGLTLAALLRKHGVDCVILEGRESVTRHPQAHFVSMRSMEIFRSIDVRLQQAIENICPPRSDWRSFIYGTSLPAIARGDVIARYDHFASRTDAQIESADAAISPCRVVHVPQTRLVPLLLDSIFSPQPAASARASVSLHAGPQFQVSGVACAAPSRPAELRLAGGARLRAQFVLAADGASSRVRGALGVGVRDPRTGRPAAPLQHLVNVHFGSAQLVQLLRDAPAMLYFIYHPHAVGVLVAHSLAPPAGDFVLQLPFFPPGQSPDRSFSGPPLARLLRALTGADDVCVRSLHPWVMHAALAERVVHETGRIVLLGDAAHQFPPAGGLGMNTGIADAHGLAWRVAAAASGAVAQTNPASLHQYERERQQAARASLLLSLRNYDRVLRTTALLGLDARAAATLQSAMSAAASVLPHGLVASLTDAALALGRTPLRAGAALGRRRAQQFIAGGGGLPLLFPGHDLGLRYGDDSAAPAAGAATAEAAEAEAFAPALAVGARLPHAWLGAAGGLSTLDVVAAGAAATQIRLDGVRGVVHVAAPTQSTTFTLERGAVPPWLAAAGGACEVRVRPDGVVASIARGL